MDLWYATSNDDGVTWTNPQQVSSLNTAGNEHQPHLYKDALNQWWLYYATPDVSGKYAIYRSLQTIPGNWNSWGAKQLVVGPGNSAGIGEPTLTQNGDLSFVVVMEDPNFTSTDRFDADPWFLPKLNSTLVNEHKIYDAILYPNPSTSEITVRMPYKNNYKVNVYDILGKEIYSEEHTSSFKLNKSSFGNGLFIVKLYKDDELIKTEKIVFVD